MDNKSLTVIINKVPILKYKYLGSYPANFLPVLLENSFMIVNTDRHESSGSHWILIANKLGKIYYGDSYAQPLDMYHHVSITQPVTAIVSSRLQRMEWTCGLYCIYFAWSVYNNFIPISPTFNDWDLMLFVHQFV